MPGLSLVVIPVPEGHGLMQSIPSIWSPPPFPDLACLVECLLALLDVIREIKWGEDGCCPVRIFALSCRAVHPLVRRPSFLFAIRLSIWPVLFFNCHTMICVHLVRGGRLSYRYWSQSTHCRGATTDSDTDNTPVPVQHWT